MAAGWITASRLSMPMLTKRGEMQLSSAELREIAANYRQKAEEMPARRGEFLAKAQDGENLAKIAEQREKTAPPSTRRQQAE